MRCAVILCLLGIALNANVVHCTSEGTVVWDATNGRFLLRVDETLDANPFILAKGTFNDSIQDNGWGFLDIETAPSDGRYLDYHLAYAAGLLEGRLTRDLIRKQINNVYHDYCANNTAYCERLQKFLQENLHYMLEMSRLYGLSDPFWHQVDLALIQLAGIQSGMKDLNHFVCIGENLIPNVTEVMYLSLHGDLQDLEHCLGKVQDRQPGSFSSCSGLIKLTNKDLLVGHSTWSGYNTMLRIQKRIAIHVRTTLLDGDLVPGWRSTFSSYPGRVISGDDFYLLSSGLVISETTIENNNKSLCSYTTPRTVLSWVRNLVANRLASAGQEWAEIYAYNNSGTYNNQWMIVDYKKFNASQTVSTGLFHVLEQMPGHVHHEDMSWFLEKFGFWPSYNTPFFEDIFNISSQWDLVEKYGDWFTYDKTPRALIFARDQSTVHDVESLRKLLRYNDFKNDPLSRCNCTPPFSGENAIASRSDLNPTNGTYPFAALGHRVRGATDVKVVNSSMIASLSMVIQSGPTNEQQPTFKWSSSDFAETIRHDGHPDVFDFRPVYVTWPKKV